MYPRPSANSRATIIKRLSSPRRRETSPIPGQRKTEQSMPGRLRVARSEGVNAPMHGSRERCFTACWFSCLLVTAYFQRRKNNQQTSQQANHPSSSPRQVILTGYFGFYGHPWTHASLQLEHGRRPSEGRQTHRICGGRTFHPPEARAAHIPRPKPWPTV